MPAGFYALIPAALLVVLDVVLHGEWFVTRWQNRKMIRQHKREVKRL